jgi:hypothetical protein
MTTFDEHVNQALALIAPTRRPAAQPAGTQQGTRPHLVLVRGSNPQGSARR